MAKIVRVAVVQDCPVPFDLSATAAKVEQLTTKAAETGARIVVFPEAFVSAYPKGLAGPEFQGPTILTADIDLGDIARGKFNFDATGHYARPDIFRLYVNEREMTAVSNSVGAMPDRPEVS